MELVYLWVEKYGDIFENEGFNLSSNWECSIEGGVDGILTISEKKLIPKNFYGDNIKSVVGMVGENGSGKSTIINELAFGDQINCSKYYIVFENGTFILSKEYGTGKNKRFSQVVVNRGTINLKSINFFDNHTNYFSKLSSAPTYYDILLLRGNLMPQKLEAEHSVSSTTVNNTYNLTNNAYILSGSKVTERHSTTAIVPIEAKLDINLFSIQEMQRQIFYAILKKRSFKQDVDKTLGLDRFIPDKIELRLSYRSYDENIQVRNVNFESRVQEAIDELVNHIQDFFHSKIENTFDQEDTLILQFYSLLHIAILKNFVSFFDRFTESEKKHYQDTFTLVSSSIVDWCESQINEINSNKSNYHNFYYFVESILDLEISFRKKEIEFKKSPLGNLNIELRKLVKIFEEKRIFQESEGLEYSESRNGEIEFISLNVDSTILQDIMNLKLMLYPIIQNDLVVLVWHDLSDGEKSLLNIYARLSDAEIIEKIKKGGGKSFVILFDEIDLTFHPEWQRQLVSRLTTFFKDDEFYHDKKIQLIFATHSPFLLSDIPASDTIWLKQKVKGEKQITQSADEMKTFGANIHELFAHSFFMDSTIGAFAEGKIREVIRILTRKTKVKYHIKNEKRMYIEYIIGIVGEPIIEKRLRDLYLSKFETYLNAQPSETQILKDEIERLKIENTKLKKVYDQSA